MTYDWPHVAGNTAACIHQSYTYLLYINLKFCFKFFGSLLWCHPWWQSWHHCNFRFPVQGVVLYLELFCVVLMAHNYKMLMSLTLAWKKCQLFAPHLTIVFTTSLPCDVSAWRRKLLLAPHIFLCSLKNTAWSHYCRVNFSKNTHTGIRHPIAHPSGCRWAMGNDLGWLFDSQSGHVLPFSFQCCARYLPCYITVTSHKHQDVSNYWPLDCLYNDLYRAITKTSKFQITGPLWKKSAGHRWIPSIMGQ